jgi:TolB-like protein/DNA-binding winged helix-turn-helix (wHTH) protein/Tfp pilus assembly protein PilF
VPITIFEFGDFRLDCTRFELLRDGRSIKLERKPMELLILLAEREGELVARAEIIERLWGNEVFVDTEHGINTAIRKIRQALRDDPEQPRFVQTILGRGYRFVGAAVKVQPSPALGNGHIAPANEGLPEPVALPASPTTVSPIAALSGDPAAPSRSHLRLWLAVGASVALVLLSLAVTLRGHWSRERLNPATPNIHSLAVLPLDNLSGDPAQNYFADGMTDELITMLAKNSTLRIVSRTSVMQYKGAHRPLPEIAQALGVDGVIEGSVERADDKVHMTLQLIHAPTDTHVWAESYDRSNNDVAALPDEAAAAIARQLRSVAPAHAAARYVSPEAHDAYLRGHYFWMVGRNEEAGKYFQQAVQIQPDYALGWAGLSEYYSIAAYLGELNPLEVLPQAEATGRKAVELDDSLAQAHSDLGAAIFFNRHDGVQALNEIRRANQLDPEFTSQYHLRAKILCALGRHEEAIAVQEQATAADPIEHPGARAEIFLCARQYDAAIKDARLRLEDFPAAPDVLSYLADSYHWKGADKEATEMLAREFAAEHNPQLAAAVRHAFQVGGYAAVVRCQLADLEKKARSGTVPIFGLARLHALLGERDKTLALLEQALNEGEPLLLWIQTDPAFDFLHKDERYRSVIRRIGLPPAW